MGSDEKDERVYTKAEVSRAVDRYTARTIPFHVELHARETVLSGPEMETLLRGARVLALGPCECREKHGNCDAPLDVCISLNEWAEQTIERGRAHVVTLEEALEALRLSHKAGLVHLAYRKRDQEVSLVCSCCSCCFFLTALKRFDYHDALVESAYVASYDPHAAVIVGSALQGVRLRRGRSPKKRKRGSLSILLTASAAVCASVSVPPARSRLSEERGKGKTDLRRASLRPY